jgi:hypothetical protein
VRLSEDAQQSDQNQQQKQCLCQAFIEAHGKGVIFLRAFCTTAHDKGCRQLLFLLCVVKKRMAKIIYRALSDVAHDKGALPCKMLPCVLTKNARQRVCCAF